MGRAISIQAMRRTAPDAQVEVMSAGGYWLSYGLLSDASRNNVHDLLDEYVHLISKFNNPGVEFEWHKNAPDVDIEDDDTDDTVLEDGDGDKTDGDGDPQPQPDSGNEQKDSGMEDIVRRIADEVSSKNDTVVTEAIVQYVDEKLESFTPKLSGGVDLDTVIARVELVKPEPITLDGLFHSQFPLLMKCVQAGKHCYLPGPPGTGKSHAAEQVATALGWRFASISFGPTTPESRLWGGMDAHGNFFEPPFVKLARFAQDNLDSGAIMCFDELDNAHAGIVATVNSAMANGWFTAPNGDVVRMGRNYVVIGAANTYGTGPTAEFAGRNRLDAATLDRFVYLPWDTDLGVENALVRSWLQDPSMATLWLNVWRAARSNAADHGLKVFVTMRGCVSGAQLVASGIEPEQAFALVLGNKVPADQLAKINPF
jgi:AAA domain (dynein-related subfamily)